MPQHLPDEIDDTYLSADAHAGTSDLNNIIFVGPYTVNYAPVPHAHKKPYLQAVALDYLHLDDQEMYTFLSQQYPLLHL